MLGLGFQGVGGPQPINLFMNIPVHEGGTLGWEPARSRPGDYVELRAEMELIVVLSSCPQDLVPISDGGLSELAIELLGES